MNAHKPCTPTVPALEISSRPDHTLVRLHGCASLNEENASAVRRHLSALPERVARERVVLDIAGVQYATSTGLGTLVDFHRRVRSAGGSLALANAAPLLRETLGVTHLDRVLEVWAN